MCVYLKWQVRDDAGDSKANQEQVGEDEGSGGVDDLLDLFVGAAGLTRLPDKTEQNRVRLFFNLYFSLFSFLLCVFTCASSPLCNLLIIVLAVFEPPVHDVANHRRGDQTQKLEHAKDGRVNTH